jgi:hypothetical protein
MEDVAEVGCDKAIRMEKFRVVLVGIFSCYLVVLEICTRSVSVLEFEILGE